MTPTQEKIAVMQAFEDGKKIEFKTRLRATYMVWGNLHWPSAWDWVNCDYRVKKEKKTLWGIIKPGLAEGRGLGAGGHGGGCWFNTESEVRKYYETSIAEGWQVVSVEVEVDA